MPKKAPQVESPIKAFKKAARELGAEASEERFKDVLRTLAKAKPSPQPKKDKQT